MSGAGRWVVVAALACSALVIGVYLALGGASYKPLEVADPCEPRPDPAAAERSVAEDLALSALDGAACALRVPREELALALATPEGREEFIAEYRLDDEDIETAVRAGLERAIDDAEADGRLSSLEATALRQVADSAPVDVVIDILQSDATDDVLDVARELGIVP